MPEGDLPEWRELVHHVLKELESARNRLSAARDWLNSQWHPAGSPLRDTAADARTSVLKIIAITKGQIDEAKGILWDSENPG